MLVALRLVAITHWISLRRRSHTKTQIANPKARERRGQKRRGIFAEEGNVVFYAQMPKKKGENDSKLINKTVLFFATVYSQVRGLSLLPDASLNESQAEKNPHLTSPNPAPQAPPLFSCFWPPEPRHEPPFSLSRH